MSDKTQHAYSMNAKEYSYDWHNQPQPIDMYEILQRYFIVGGETADIGCGSGRDANWLAAHGYKVTGYDSSSELIQIASEKYPNIQFKQAHLPTLDDVDKSFDYCKFNENFEAWWGALFILASYTR